MFLSAHPQANLDLLRIHAEDAAFLLSQRALACEAPNYRLVDLFDLEQRLCGHLDALALAEPAGCHAALAATEAESAEPDGAAVLLHVALRQGRGDLIETAAAGVPENAERRAFLRRLSEGASWCSPSVLSTVMGRWIEGTDACFRWIALEVCGIHRVDPRHHLERALRDPDEEVRRRAARLAGELGRADLRAAVEAVGGDEADLAAVLLGNHARAARLADPANFPTESATARAFAEVLPLGLSQSEACSAIRDLLASQATRRWGIVAIGALGWSGALPSLVELMQDPTSARVAVSALEQITGIYFAHEELELEDFPEDPEGPGLDRIETFADTATPWPDSRRVRTWVEANLARYSDRERLLLGVPAWTFDGAPEPWVRYQARHRWIAITQAMRAPSAPLPAWAGRVRLEGRSFGRAW